MTLVKYTSDIGNEKKLINGLGLANQTSDQGLNSPSAKKSEGLRYVCWQPGADFDN